MDLKFNPFDPEELEYLGLLGFMPGSAPPMENAGHPLKGPWVGGVRRTATWNFPRPSSNKQIKDWLADKGFVPQGFACPLISSHSGWKDVSSVRITRSGPTARATQTLTITYF